MATLYISEYSNVATVGVGYGPAAAAGQAPQEPPLAEQVISSWPGVSAAFQANTRLVRIHTDSICSIAFGTAPSASTSNARLAANQTEYFGVPQGASFKVSVVANT